MLLSRCNEFNNTSRLASPHLSGTGEARHAAK